ncbi:MAG: prepilin-type N-terminal cleavage/methylation domain-containing protein [Pyrinomonadaceae bacterium]
MNLSCLKNESGSRVKRESGFSILELMIAMFILIILLAVAVPTYRNSVQHARETVLKENLYQLRYAINQYSADKNAPPSNLEDLVTAGYLREIPVDPVNLEQRDWEVVTGTDPALPDGEEGVVNVKSKAEGEDSDGVSYSNY